MKAGPVPSTEAAMVLGIASTAMPFAGSREAEAERWLRVLRMYGEVGTALQALGVGEARLGVPGNDADGERPAAWESDDRDVIAIVTEHAASSAAQRGADTLNTSDVLVAVMQVYGADFDRVLQMHGTDRDETLRRLGAKLPEPANGRRSGRPLPGA